MDINTILATMSQMSSQVSAQVPSQLKEQEARISSRMLSQMLTQQPLLSSQMSAQMLELQFQLSSQLKDLEERISKQISAQVTAQITEVLTQISAEQDKIKAKVDELKNRLRELQLNRPIISTDSAKVKTPSFNGTIPFQIFKLQFEKIAAANNWNPEDKLVALKGSVSEILQTIPNCESSTYEMLMDAIERRYGSEHKKRIFLFELLNRHQQADESLQEFATEIERLAHLALAHKSVQYIEDIKIQSFVNGIRNETTRYAALAYPKLTFAETVWNGLTHETAFLLSKRPFQANQGSIT